MVDRGEAADVEQVDEALSPVAFPPIADPALDRIAALAADLFGVSSAGLALRRRDIAAFQAWAGPRLAPREAAWKFPLSETAPISVIDLPADPRMIVDRSAFGAGLRFYAGAPMRTPDGDVVGTLCVLGSDPRVEASRAEMGRLAALADLAADAMAAHLARERAEATAEAKSGLLADISHEMRTPLNGILAFTQLLKRGGALDGDALRAVERIDEAGRGLLSIVGDALDLSRFESGLVRLDPRPFSPTRLVEDAAAMVRADAERKGLRLLVDLPDAATEDLLGDPDRLRQVVLNLLSNAVKFTAHGTVRLGLTLGRGGEPDGAVPLTVAVEDSGIGIAAERVPRLFRRFVQADDTVARRFGGNGLGLAISRTIVDAMGGSIAVKSDEGAGARFTVSLTLPRAEEPHDPVAARDPVAGRDPAAPHGPLSGEWDGLHGLPILLAEDAAMNQKLVLQMLEPLGVAVDVVADGAAAVAAVARRDYALVLMDMEMPVLDGLDATRRIRSLGGAAAAVPIVALTANVFPEQLDLCRDAGMDDCLTKPFGAEALAAVALRWARRPAPADGGAP